MEKIIQNFDKNKLNSFNKIKTYNLKEIKVFNNQDFKMQGNTVYLQVSLPYKNSKSHQRDYVCTSSCMDMDHSLNDPKEHPPLEPPNTHYIGYTP